MAQPIIGISLDSEDVGSFAPSPYYALRKHYSDAISAAGGIPLFFPHDMAHIATYLNLIDGLLVPGGNVDVDPQYYGDEPLHHTTILNPSRTNFDMELMRQAFERGLPIFGICAGQQIMNVLFGGTLYQSLKDQVPNLLPHYHDEPRHALVHRITVVEDSLLGRILHGFSLEFQVNSHHRQAARAIGEHILVSAVASDGVIEAIEHKNHPFCLGVEWHPEYMNTEEDRTIMQAFIAAASRYKASTPLASRKLEAV